MFDLVDVRRAISPGTGKAMERFYPVGIGAVVAISCLIWGTEVFSYGNSLKWHFEQLYAAVFGFLAITTGFLGTFYGTIQSVGDGFIKKISKTATLKRYLLQVKSAIVRGFVASLLSIPMMVVAPTPEIRFEWHSIVVSFWIGFAAYAIASFYRVASLFFLLFESNIEDRHLGN